jgi:tight adherence protein C
VDPFVDPGVIAGCLAAAAVGVGAAAVASTARSPLDAAFEATSSPPRPRPAFRRRRRREARALHDEVTQLLDLLAAGSTAGLSAELSFRQAVSCLRGPLADDLAAVIRQVDLGAPWRSEIASFVERSGDADLVRTMTVLARSEALGVSLRDATRDLAETVRDAHRSETLERARSAPVKMLFPLVFMILPAFLLLTVVPVLITTVRTI